MRWIPLPSIFGVPVRTSWTWLLIALSLSIISAYYFAPESASSRELSGWLAGILFLNVGVVISLIAHDFGHIWTAGRSGTRMEALEPSLVGALPDTCYEPQSPADELRVASAGPIVSLILAAAAGAAWLVAQSPESMPGLAILLLGVFNLGLMSLNLLPGYPFDGGRLFRAFIWHLNGDLVDATRAAAAYGQFFILAGFLAGVVLLSEGETYALWGAWILLLCWTVNRARTEGVTQTVWREAGRRLQIDDLFQAGVNRVSASATIDDSIESLLDNFRRGPTLVVGDSEVIGVVDLNSFRKIPRVNWTHMTIGEAMRPLNDLLRLDTHESVSNLLAELPNGSTRIILVQRDGKIVAAANREFVLDRVESYIRAERLLRPRRR